MSSAMVGNYAIVVMRSILTEQLHQNVKVHRVDVRPEKSFRAVPAARQLLLSVPTCKLGPGLYWAGFEGLIAG